MVRTRGGRGSKIPKFKQTSDVRSWLLIGPISIALSSFNQSERHVGSNDLFILNHYEFILNLDGWVLMYRGRVVGLGCNSIDIVTGPRKMSIELHPCSPFFSFMDMNFATIGQYLFMFQLH